MIIMVSFILILFIGGVSCLVLGILNLVKGKEKVNSIIAIILGVLITTVYTNTIIISIFTKYIMR